MDSILSNGRTVEEAIESGLKKLNASKENVEITIIQQPQKSFFLTKKAIVKIEVKVRDNMNNTSHLSSQDGLVWIQNGQLHFNASSQNSPSLTIPHDEVIIQDEIELPEKNVTLKEGHSYRIKLQSEVMPQKWSIETDELNMTVYLSLSPKVVIERILEDAPPSGHLNVRITERTMNQADLSLEELTSELRQRDIKVDIDENLVNEILSNPVSGRHKIAGGLHPVAGVDGFIDFQIQTEIKEIFTSDEKGKINFRERNTLPAVEAGDIIGEVKEPVAGTAGYDIFKQPLQPKDPDPVSYILKSGVRVDGSLIVAEIAGRPSINKKKHSYEIGVENTFFVDGDVGLESGNIVYKGNVEVKGSVQTGMKVEASGDITVNKSINQATCLAGDSVIIKGHIITSQVTTGHENRFKKAGELIVIINNELNRLDLTLQQVKGSAKYFEIQQLNRGVAPILELLIDANFKGLKGSVQSLHQISNHDREEFPEPFQKVMENLYQFFLQTSKSSVDFRDLEELMFDLNKLMQHFHESKPSDIECLSVINSELTSAGDITIKGDSCVNAQLEAEGTIVINGSFRGGKAHAKRGIVFNEAGAVSGTPTHLCVSAGGFIRGNHAFEGTVLEIGKNKKVLEKNYQSFEAAQNEHGYISMREKSEYQAQS
ncbi:FapA family protein [Jeotgalibacillus aurantiacus]|uniref:FapA family protein n=1 Tax=Jeotgalibacillus aurantiacus TaxID=2763266 RepID=UPI001D0B52AE|nr:FapA family protein [Jeotgalibacillus aurantiacus]